VIVVVDKGSHVIRSLEPQGRQKTRVLAGMVKQKGSRDGPVAQAQFTDPISIAEVCHHSGTL
jgi:hypothetical protein